MNLFLGILFMDNLNRRIETQKTNFLSLQMIAVKKTMYLSLLEIEKKWTQPIHNCWLDYEAIDPYI